MKRKKATKEGKSSSFATPDLGQIEQLLQFMSEHNLEEFEYAKGDLRIRLKKPGANTVVAVPRPAEIIVPGAIAAPALAAKESSDGGPEVDLRGGEDLFLVKSPIVGTFYASPSRGAEAFVKIGDHVDAGQTICCVEAMHLLNRI